MKPHIITCLIVCLIISLLSVTIQAQHNHNHAPPAQPEEQPEEPTNPPQPESNTTIASVTTDQPKLQNSTTEDQPVNSTMSLPTNATNQNAIQLINQTVVGSTTASENRTVIGTMEQTITINETASNSSVNQAVNSYDVSILLVGNTLLSNSQSQRNQTIKFLHEYYYLINQSVYIESCILPLPLFSQSNDDSDGDESERSVMDSADLKDAINHFIKQSINQYIVVADIGVHALFKDLYFDDYVDSINQLIEMVAESNNDQQINESVKPNLILVEPPLPCNITAMQSDPSCLSIDESNHHSINDLKIDESTTYGSLMDLYITPFMLQAVTELSSKQSVRVLPLGQTYKAITQTTPINGLLHSINLSHLDGSMRLNDFLIASMLFAMTTSNNQTINLSLDHSISTNHSFGISPNYARIDFLEDFRTPSQQLASLMIEQSNQSFNQHNPLTLIAAFDTSKERAELIQTALNKANSQTSSDTLEKPKVEQPSVSLTEADPVAEPEPQEPEPVQQTNQSNNQLDNNNNNNELDNNQVDGEPNNDPGDDKEKETQSQLSDDDTDLVQSNLPTVDQTDLLYPILYLSIGILVSWCVYSIYRSVNQSINEKRLRNNRGYDVSDMDGDDGYFDTEKQHARGYAHDDGL